MPEPLVRLKDRVEQLGNHNRKFLLTIAAHKGKLVERLEASGKADRVHLWTPAHEASAEMETIGALGKDLGEKLSFLSCYYALQVLNMNLRAVDVLVMNLASAPDRLGVYKEFMKRVGLEFRKLTTAYMDALLNLFLPAGERSQFVICGVGTRADQDDIDVGIIDDGGPKRSPLNQAIGQISSEMFKRASPLHFYLSEHVGAPGYSASIAEYNHLLDKEIQDFIIISEMLGAARILGSEELFGQFQQGVTSRYYYQPGGNNKYHEGYLRGILGEVRSLHLRKMKEDSINPKDDGLRLIKGLISVGKVIFGVKKVNNWEILEALTQKNPARAWVYQNLDRALTFLEIFRYLYQLFVAQEEEIFLGDDQTAPDLQRIAEIMGYQDVGVIRARDHLLIHYYENVAMAKDTIGVLFQDAAEHLKTISIFAPMLDKGRLKESGKKKGVNLAVDFGGQLRFFRGTKFWDDVLEAFGEKDGQLLVRFLDDFNALGATERKRIIRRYIEWGSYSFYALLSLLVILHKNRKRFSSTPLFRDLNGIFLRTMSDHPNTIQKLTRVFNQYPQLIHDYLTAIPEEEQQAFAGLLRGKIWEPEVAGLRDKMVHLCEFHYANSRYFKRFFLRVIERYPEYLKHLDDPWKLAHLADGILANIENIRSFAGKKEEVGDYYDLAFLRVGLQTLKGALIHETNAAFTEFSDNYLQTLFDICKQEVDLGQPSGITTDDLLAIYVAGGHAREQAYDDDYDIVFILNSDDPDILKYTTKIVTKMNTEIIKRGILPHYRFVQHFGNYVTRLCELDRYFSEHVDSDSFIDKSQILGSRMVVGSSAFEREFEERIIKPHIFEKWESYVCEMKGEIESRHCEGTELNVKESRGGLRDIEMVLLIYKASYRLREPISSRLFETLGKIDKDHAREFQELSEAFDFLKNLRDVYRLSSAADDTLYPQSLGRAARVLGFSDSDGQPPEEKLLAAFRQCTEQVSRIIDKLVEDILPKR